MEELHGTPGTGDDRLSAPSVVPEPAPPDDQLAKLAVVGTVVAGLAALMLMQWLRRNLVVSRRSG